MTDFGRKDFGDALKRMFGEALSKKERARLDPEADEIGAFGATSKLAKGVGDKGALDTMEADFDTMLDAFEQRWNTMKDTLRSSVTSALQDMQAYAAANTGLTANDTETSRGDAEIAALGGTKQQVADKFARVDAAGPDRKMQGSKVQGLSRQDIDQGAPDITPDQVTGGANKDDVMAGLAAGGVQGVRADRARRTTRAAAARKAAQTGGTNV